MPAGERSTHHHHRSSHKELHKESRHNSYSDPPRDSLRSSQRDSKTKYYGAGNTTISDTRSSLPSHLRDLQTSTAYSKSPMTAYHLERRPSRQGDKGKGFDDGTYAYFRKDETATQMTTSKSSPRGSGRGEEPNLQRRASTSYQLNQPTSTSSPKGNSTIRTKLWSINFSCPSGTEGKKEYRIEFPYEYDVYKVLDTCGFADCENGDFYLLTTMCGSHVKTGHGDCHAPIDRSRITSHAVDDPDHYYLVRQCTPSERDRSLFLNKADNIVYLQSRYEVGSKAWHEEFDNLRRHNRKQRMSYRDSVLDHHVDLQRSQNQSKYQTVEKLTKNTEEMKNQIGSIAEALTSLIQAEEQSKAPKTQLARLFGVQGDTSTLRSHLEFLRTDVESFLSTDKDSRHTNFHVIRRQQHDIERLRRERNEYKAQCSAMSKARRDSRH